MSEMIYRVIVTRKTGRRVMEFGIRQGDPPNIGEAIDVKLDSNTVRAEVGSHRTPAPNEAGGERPIEVLAHEV